MKLNRLIIAVMLIFTLFACKDKGVVSCYLTVARPPMEAINAYTKSLSSLEARDGDEFVLTAKATIYTEDGNEIKESQATFSDGAEEVTLLFTDLTPANSVYAEIQVGINHGGVKFQRLYGGCSDFFNIEDGKTIPVSICATKDEDYSFDYTCADVTIGQNQVTYGENSKKLINLSSSNMNVDSYDLSTISFGIKGNDEEVRIGAALCYGEKFYAVANTNRTIYLVRCDKSSVIHSNSNGVTFESSDVISLGEHRLSSNVENYRILDMRVRGGFLCLEIEVHDDKNKKQCPYYCYIDLKYNSWTSSDLVKEIGEYSSDGRNEHTVYDYLFPLTVGDKNYHTNYQVLWNSNANTLSFRSMQQDNTGGSSLQEKFKVTINSLPTTDCRIECSRPLYIQDQGDLLFFANNYCVRIKDLSITRDQSVSATQIIDLTSGDNNYFKGVGLENAKNHTGTNDTDPWYYDFGGICCYKDVNKLYAIYINYGVFIFDIEDKDGPPKFLDSYIMFNLTEAYYKAKKLYLFEHVGYRLHKDLNKSNADPVDSLLIQHTINTLNINNLKNGKMPTPMFLFMRDSTSGKLSIAVGAISSGSSWGGVFKFTPTTENGSEISNVKLKNKTYIGSEEDGSKTEKEEKDIMLTRNNPTEGQSNQGYMGIFNNPDSLNGKYIYWGFSITYSDWDNSETIYTDCYQGS